MERYNIKPRNAIGGKTMSKNPKKHVTIYDEVKKKEVSIPEREFWKHHFLNYMRTKTVEWGEVK
tara:strand:+ start:282 stop:473 length:192 start_codon:yes stop_codon:yes gene_type:complete